MLVHRVGKWLLREVANVSKEVFLQVSRIVKILLNAENLSFWTKSKYSLFVHKVNLCADLFLWSWFQICLRFWFAQNLTFIQKLLNLDQPESVFERSMQVFSSWKRSKHNISWDLKGKF